MGRVLRLRRKTTISSEKHVAWKMHAIYNLVRSVYDITYTDMCTTLYIPTCTMQIHLHYRFVIKNSSAKGLCDAEKICYSSGIVKISTPSRVISRVCSNWADLPPGE
jgi:hypothetical protein